MKMKFYFSEIPLVEKLSSSITQEKETKTIQNQIDLFRSQSKWNQIINLINSKNLTDLWFQTFQGEALHFLSRKKEAKKFFVNVIKTSNKEDPIHMFLIGKIYDIVRDSQKSFHWLEKAAELGEPNAQNYIGNYYVKKYNS
jgi:TPR repeat protein